MLESFYVNNFRLFKHLELPKLGQVNLIAGKNGSGKSALLEAIRLYASNADPGVFADLIFLRKEYWSPKERPHFDKTVSGQVLKHLFFGHKLPELNGEGIRVGKSADDHFHLTVAVYLPLGEAFAERVPYTREGGSRPLTTMDIEELSNESDISFSDKYLVLEQKGQTRRLVNLDKSLNDLMRPSYLHDHSRYPIQFVCAQSTDSNDLASLWDKIGLTSLGPEVIAGLQLIEQKIKMLSFVDAENQRSMVRIPMVQHSDFLEPLSLQIFGDGILRLFEILLSLVNARDGILVIDELENGLHYKIHPKVWDIVFRLAKKLNVQVFATTHSWDCIRGFEVVWREHLDEGTFFRLDMKEDQVKATYYDAKTLSDALRLDVEVR